MIIYWIVIILFIATILGLSIFYYIEIKEHEALKKRYKIANNRVKEKEELIEKLRKENAILLLAGDKKPLVVKDYSPTYIGKPQRKIIENRNENGFTTVSIEEEIPYRPAETFEYTIEFEKNPYLYLKTLIERRGEPKLYSHLVETEMLK